MLNYWFNIDKIQGDYLALLQNNHNNGDHRDHGGRDPDDETDGTLGGILCRKQN